MSLEIFTNIKQMKQIKFIKKIVSVKYKETKFSTPVLSNLGTIRIIARIISSSEVVWLHLAIRLLLIISLLIHRYSWNPYCYISPRRWNIWSILTKNKFCHMQLFRIYKILLWRISIHTIPFTYILATLTLNLEKGGVANAWSVNWLKCHVYQSEEFGDIFH